ncbi:thioesterase family protein [Aspergillus candidus]|uniref:Thioesterase family protein n=1 Tax=Aspergillus candidus TaxID=41067 RepID=A0A2I2F7T2_ASPCN|nr:thioesterase family protein [Aspergillus candidus]PLB36682.1 thioesterase family protein [Aspergillus candidus]
MSIMIDPLPQDQANLHPFQHHPFAHLLLQNPDYYPIQTWSRLPKPSTGEDGYMAQTLSTPTTIPHCLTLRRRDLRSEHLPSAPPVWPSPTADPAHSAPSARDPDAIMMFDLASPGVSGHPDMAHGGVVAALIDETMSMAVTLHSPPSFTSASSSDPVSADSEPPTPRGKLFTAQLDVRYKQPTILPGLVVVRAKVVARVGRKFWVRAQVVQPGDQMAEEVITADAMAFWLQTAAAGTARL